MNIIADDSLVKYQNIDFHYKFTKTLYFILSVQMIHNINL